MEGTVTGFEDGKVVVQLDRLPRNHRFGQRLVCPGAILTRV
jgi:hypothetical protein